MFMLLMINHCKLTKRELVSSCVIVFWYLLGRFSKFWDIYYALHTGNVLRHVHRTYVV